MGIGIAPGGGVGLVPLNNPQPQAGTAQPPTNGRGRTRGDHHMHPITTRGPTIAGYAWDAPPATTTTTRQGNTSTGQAASTSNVANSNGNGRRRDGTPTGSSGSSRFGRGLTERIRALGAAGNPAPVTTALMQQMGIQAPAPSVIAPGDPNTVRPRAWERLFGRDGNYGGMLAPTVTPGPVESTPPSRDVAALTDHTNWGRVPRPTRSSSGPSASTADHSGTSVEVEQMRQYLSLSARSRGVVHLPGHLTDENLPSTSTAPSTDLSGMVRNNLVLAGQPGSSSLPSSNVVAMRVALGPNERPANGYASTLSRPGLATRGSSTGGTLTMLDPANATGSMWNTYESEEGMQ